MPFGPDRQLAQFDYFFVGGRHGVRLWQAARIEDTRFRPESMEEAARVSPSGGITLVNRDSMIGTGLPSEPKGTAQ